MVLIHKYRTILLNIDLLTWLLDSRCPENQLCEVATSHMYPWEVWRFSHGQCHPLEEACFASSKM